MKNYERSERPRSVTGGDWAIPLSGASAHHAVLDLEGPSELTNQYPNRQIFPAENSPRTQFSARTMASRTAGLNIFGARPELTKPQQPQQPAGPNFWGAQRTERSTELTQHSNIFGDWTQSANFERPRFLFSRGLKYRPAPRTQILGLTMAPSLSVRQPRLQQSEAPSQ